jgi:hypothetical protein
MLRKAPSRGADAIIVDLADGVRPDALQETLRVTNLGDLAPGDGLADSARWIPPPFTMCQTHPVRPRP